MGMYLNAKSEIVRAGLTLEPIAKELGITVPTLSLKLNGRYPLTLNEAVIIKNVIQRTKIEKGITMNVDMPLELLFEEVG